MNSDELVFSRLEALEKTLHEKLQMLLKPVEQVQEELGHVRSTIALLRRDAKAFDQFSERIPTHIAKLRGMTQLDAIITIAKDNGGIVRAQEAKRLMIKAGIMRNTKNATNMTHNVFSRSDRFERIGPGEFKLKSLERGHLLKGVRVALTPTPIAPMASNELGRTYTYGVTDSGHKEIDKQDSSDLLAAEKRIVRQ
jgi:hypothetical protein